MPGSEGKRELGGLARSIDALFSTPQPSPEPSEPDGMDVPPADALEVDFAPFDGEVQSEAPAEPEVLAEADAFTEPGAVSEPEVLVERDTLQGAGIFEDVEIVEELEAATESEAVAESGSIGDAEPPTGSRPIVAEPLPFPGELEANEPELEWSEPWPEWSEPELEWSEPEPASDVVSSLDDLQGAPELFSSQEAETSAAAGAGTSEPSAFMEEPTTEEPTAEEFAEAVEALLSGSSGAAEEVERMAEALRERLTLDPLADAVERLLEAAGDPPDETILEAARSIMNPAVASRIVQRMARERDEERLAEYNRMCKHLGLLMANAFRGALTESTDEHARRVYHDALIGMGQESRPVIEGMIEDDNRFLVLSAVAILGEIGGPRAVELVTSALADTDPRVRREALLSLGKLGDEEAGQLVLGSFEDPDHNVRVAAAIAAGELALERGLRPVLAMLAEEDEPDVLISLLGALGQIGDPGAVQAIEKHAVGRLFSKPRTDVRVAAYRALHDIGTPHARQLLDEALSDKDRGVQIVVRDLLKED